MKHVLLAPYYLLLFLVAVVVGLFYGVLLSAAIWWQFIIHLPALVKALRPQPKPEPQKLHLVS